MGMLKGRHVEVKVVKDDGEPPAIEKEIVVPADIAKEVQETVRIISSHVIIGMGVYVLADTFRKVVVKMVPGH